MTSTGKLAIVKEYDKEEALVKKHFRINQHDEARKLFPHQ